MSQQIDPFLLGNEVFRPVRELGRIYHQDLNGVSAAKGICALLADRPEVLEPATRAANAHVFIARLPAGYDTVVVERSLCLSGGERQSLAIARARGVVERAIHLGANVDVVAERIRPPYASQ